MITYIKIGNYFHKFSFSTRRSQRKEGQALVFDANSADHYLGQSPRELLVKLMQPYRFVAMKLNKYSDDDDDGDDSDDDNDDFACCQWYNDLVLVYCFPWGYTVHVHVAVKHALA